MWHKMREFKKFQNKSVLSSMIIVIKLNDLLTTTGSASHPDQYEALSEAQCKSSSLPTASYKSVQYQCRVTVSCCEWWLADVAATQSWCHRLSARQLRRGATSPNPSLTSPPIRSTGKLHLSWKSLTSLSATSQCMKRSNRKETLRTNFQLWTDKANQYLMSMISLHTLVGVATAQRI